MVAFNYICERQILLISIFQEQYDGYSKEKVKTNQNPF